MAPFQCTTIVSNPFQQNTFVANLEGRKDCVIVDPGLEPDKIIQILDEKGFEPAALLITHGHSDHIGGNHALKARWPDCPIIVSVRLRPIELCQMVPRLRSDHSPARLCHIAGARSLPDRFLVARQE